MRVSLLANLNNIWYIPYIIVAEIAQFFFEVIVYLVRIIWWLIFILPVNLAWNYFNYIFFWLNDVFVWIAYKGVYIYYYVVLYLFPRLAFLVVFLWQQFLLLFPFLYSLIMPAWWYIFRGWDLLFWVLFDIYWWFMLFYERSVNYYYFVMGPAAYYLQDLSATFQHNFIAWINSD